MNTPILPHPMATHDDNPYPTAQELLRVRAQTLIDRSLALEKAGATGCQLLQFFTAPSWHELQLEDSRACETVARALADVRDARNLDNLPVRTQEQYRAAAAMALHWLEPSWKGEAFSCAIVAVCEAIDAEISPAARNCAGIDTPELEFITRTVLRKYLDTLMGKGIDPATYLRLRGTAELEARR